MKPPQLTPEQREAQTRSVAIWSCWAFTLFGVAFLILHVAGLYRPSESLAGIAFLFASLAAPMAGWAAYRLRSGGLWMAFVISALTWSFAVWSVITHVFLAPAAEQEHMWPNDWSSCLGQQVWVEGVALNEKVGAVLLKSESKEDHASRIYIDGLEAWPEVGGRRLQVRGIVIKRGDLPVFVEKPGEHDLSAGISVKNQEEVEKYRWRYLLKDAKWKVIE